MARYTTFKRVRADCDDWYEPPASPEMVTVDDAIAVDTGLLDVNGNSIWRCPNPCGFGRDEEW